ncbi:MAG: PIG-L deacetylase family protein [Methanococcaceae archaeon]
MEQAKRIMIAAAHPDDEIIGMGGRLPGMNICAVVHLTDGAPRNMIDVNSAGFHRRREYVLKRRNELFMALNLAGIDKSKCLRLNCADQETSFNLPELTMQLKEIISDVKPDIIFTHPYEGGHPDHDSTSFAVNIACMVLNKEKGQCPALKEFTSYFSLGGEMRTFDFIPHHCIETEIYYLTPEQIQLKKKMFECFETQKKVLAYFPVEVEMSRNTPVYNFSLPPHNGKLYYELFNWGISGTKWRENASAALQVLENEIVGRSIHN